MRIVALLLPLAACACSGGPGAVGITGPNPTGASPPGSYGAVQAQAPFGDDDAGPQGGPPVGTGSANAPSLAPTYGSNGRYYGE